MIKQKNLGFIEPIITPDHYVLGAGMVPQVVLQENGDWTDSLPEPEIQSKRGIETYDCTGFGLCNQVEEYLFKAFGEKVNLSDRWVGIIAGTKEGGNDPQVVYEAVRKYGMIPEEMLPFSDDIQSIEEYYSFKGADKEKCYQAGREWLAKYDFKHEWVFTASNTLEEKINNMKVALKYSPLALAVSAWSVNQTGLYQRFGRDNHWTQNFAFKVNNAMILDSYSPFIKELVEDFNFSYCKRIHIGKKAEEAPLWFVDIAKNLMELLKDLLNLDLKVLQEKKTVIPPIYVPPSLTSREIFFKTAKECLGKKLVDDAHMNLGCVLAINAVYKKAFGNELSTVEGTAALYDLLSKDVRFEQVQEPLPGDIILSVTGSGNGNVRGHVGVIAYFGILSNDSDTGIWKEKFNLRAWLDFYQGRGGLKTFFFRKK